MWRTNESDDDEVASSYARSHSGSASQHFATTAASEASVGNSYSDDEFDHYSDEFENENGSDTVEVQENSKPTLHVGDRVQVLWDDEGEWFEGSIARIEGAQCFVLYDDGDQQWEPLQIVRPAKVHSEERRDTIIAEKVMEQSNTVEIAAERVLIPRQYEPILHNHFEPVRLVRQYRPTLDNHIGSVIIPRRPDSLVRPNNYYACVDVKLKFRAVLHPTSTLDRNTAMRECEIQTEIDNGTT